jgi:hypothetical protein
MLEEVTEVNEASLEPDVGPRGPLGKNIKKAN